MSIYRDNGTIWLLKSLRKPPRKTGFIHNFFCSRKIIHFHWDRLIYVLKIYSWIWTIFPSHTKKPSLISASSSSAPWPRNNKGIITVESMAIGYLVNNVIRQLVMVPFGINLWVHVLRNKFCIILLQGSIWEYKIINTSINDWVRITNTNNIHCIVLRAIYFRSTSELVYSS